MIGSQVITEAGVILGWVKRVNLSAELKAENYQSSSLSIAPSPILWLPESIIGAYELSGNEIVSSQPRRIIVFEGAERRISISAVGVIERLGLFALLPYRFENSDDGYIMPYESFGEDKDDPGSSSTIRPRRPNPNPTNSAEVEA